MCLVMTHNHDTILEKEWIHDFYDHNPDGIGVMFAEDGKLQIIKSLPKNEDEAWLFYESTIRGRDCVVHWRMATHGNIDLTQVHPYVIAGPDVMPKLAFMHNGVLHCGNATDKTKSDTWHYNESYLKPLLDPDSGGSIDLAFRPAFTAMLGDAISDNNRFVFMDDQGRVEIVNMWTGVRWRDMWMSNTYAWDAPSRLSRYNRGKGKEEKFNDWADMPTPDRHWANWRDYEGNYPVAAHNSTTSAPTLSVVQGSGGVPHVSVTKSTVAQDGLSLTTEANKARWAEYVREEVGNVYRTLDSEGLNKAWRDLSVQDFTHFEDVADLDQLWEAVYMVVDGSLSQDDFIDYVKHPADWLNHKPRLARTNISSGEDALARIHELGQNDPDELADGGEDDTDGDNPTEEEVIEATLPSGTLQSDMPTVDRSGRPVFDCRAQ